MRIGQEVDVDFWRGVGAPPAALMAPAMGIADRAPDHAGSDAGGDFERGDIAAAGSAESCRRALRRCYARRCDAHSTASSSVLALMSLSLNVTRYYDYSVKIREN